MTAIFGFVMRCFHEYHVAPLPGNTAKLWVTKV